MRANRTNFRKSLRSLTAVSAAMLLGLGIGLPASVARAQSSAPAIAMSQPMGVSKLPAGGIFTGPNSSGAGGDSAGTSMAVNSNGDLLASNSYGGQILLFPASGWAQSPVPAPTVIASVSNPSAVTVDKSNNLYIGTSFNGTIVKLPYLGGTSNGGYATYSAPTSSTPSCTGSDQAECVEIGATAGGSVGVTSLAFDARGDLFFGTSAATGQAVENAIFECTAACMTTGTPAATLVYQEPENTTTPTTTGQLNIGGIALDPNGNLFFTDSAIQTGNNNEESFSSNLKELTYTAGSGYSSTPVVLFTYVPSSAGSYDAEIDSVATDSNGTVYMGSQAGGVVAFPNNKGVISAGYFVTTQSAKIIALDATGNIYEGYYSGGDVMQMIALDPLSVPAPASGSSSSTANFLAILSDGTTCSSTPTVTYTTSGSSGAAFTATTNSSVTCSTASTGGATPGTGITAPSGGAVVGGTVTFTPTIGGISSAVLTATDAAGNSGTANVAGSAIGTLATPTFSPAGGAFGSAQTVTISSASGGASIYYTTDGSTPSGSSTLYTGPVTVSSSETLSAIAIESGDTSSGVGTADYTINLAPTGPPDFTPAAGTYSSPQTVTITSSTPGAVIYYTTDGSTPTSSSSVYNGPITVSATETINAFAQAPGAIASSVVSSAYTINLPASVVQNVVVSQNTQLGPFGSGGGQSGTVPAGDTMAVMSNGNLLVSNTYGNEVLMYTPTSATPTMVGNFGTHINPSGIAVDSANNLYVGFSYSSNVLKIPYVKDPSTGQYAYATVTPTPSTSYSPANTAPNCTGNDTVECLMANVTGGGSGAVGLAFDSAGDLFYTTNDAAQYQPTSEPNAIYECTAACLYSGTPAEKKIFQETNAADNLGPLVLDSQGDIFFTDSTITSSGNSSVSNLNELVYTAGTGYATTPTLIYTYTPSTNTTTNELNGVAVAPNGTVYALLQNTVGLLAFPDNKGTYSGSAAYLVSPQNGKLLAMDQLGNFYIDNYSNASSGDVINYIAVNNITATAGPTASTTTATNLVTVLNDGGCSSNPTVTFTSTNQAFSAATSGTCSAAGLSSASIPTTLSFTPTAAGINTGTLTATDSASNSGTATVVGTATGALAPPTFSPAAGTYTSIQTVSISDADGGAQIYYTTDGSTPNMTVGGSTMLYTGPISVISSETINAIAVETGDTASTDAVAAYTLNIPATEVPAASEPTGTYGTPQLITLSDSSPYAQIFYTTDGSTATAASTPYTGPIPVTGNMTINAVATSPGAATSTMASFVYTISLTPSAYQAVVMTQQTQLGTLPANGGPQSGQEPAGDTIAINSLGDVIMGNTYGGKVTLFTPQGTSQTIGSLSNVEGAAVDAQNNLYLGYAYSGSTVVKVPFVNGAYVALTAPGGSTPACTGNDTAECTIKTLTTGGADVVSLLFDSKGDLFYATANADATTGTNNTLFEQPAAGLYTGSPAAVKLYSEPTSSSPNTTGQLSIGGLALDSAGDLFFTDSAVGTTNNQESFSSNVNELPVSSSTSTGYAASPTVIYTYIPATPAQSDAEIDGISVAPNGTLYFLIQNTIGIEAIPFVSGAYSSSQAYLVSTATSGTSNGGKLLGGDMYGNLYFADNNNTANVYKVTVDNITAPQATAYNTPSTATNINTVLNDAACSSSPTVTFAASGTDSSAFTATTTGACTSGAPANTAVFPTSITFAPTTAGGNTATLTATDSNGGTGVAEVSAVALPAQAASNPTFSPAAGTYTSVQTVTIASTTPNAVIYYTTDGTTPGTSAGGSTMLYTAPISVGATETVTAIATGTGIAPSQAVAAAYTINLPAGTPTFSPGPGTYTSIQTVTIASTSPNAQIFYTLDGSTPQTSSGGSTLAYTGPITVSQSETINAIATASGFSSSAVGSAVYAINLPAAATPTFSVAAGTYTTVQTVSLADATSGATIYYTLDGTVPSPTGAGSTMTYTTPITVGANETINAIAVASGYSTSDLATAIYVINLPSPSMTISSKQTTINVPNGGTGTATVTVTTNATFPVPTYSNGQLSSGGVALTCSGYLPQGYTCTVSPGTLTPGPSATVTSTVTVKAGSATTTTTTSALRNRSGILFAGTMLAGALALFGLRKRRWMAVSLMLLLSFGGFSLLSGCATTQKQVGPASSQIVITATTTLPGDNVETVTVPFVVTTQQ